MSSGAAASQATKSAEPTRGEAGRRSPEDAPGPDSSRAPVLTDAGNRAIGNLLRRRHEPIPVPACVAPENDPSEQAAHASADRIAGRQASSTEATSPSSAAGATIGLDGGQPLDAATQSRFERDLGADLDMVRIHTGPLASSAAAQLNARAYSVGNHIVFGAENFVPNTSRGSWLLAHELTHVLQHAGHRAPTVLHRAAEDVPALDKKLYDGLAKKSAGGYREAAEALNYFADFDIEQRLSDKPADGRPALTPGQIASIHAAALEHPDLGADSNAAKFTRPAYLDLNFRNEVKRGNWQGVAEYLNEFNDTDMVKRLATIPLDQLRSLQLGALQHPKLGVGSAVARNVAKAIEAATKAVPQRAVEEGQKTGAFALPTSMSGSGPPGSITSMTADMGNPNVGVANTDREPLSGDEDWQKDPQYVDNNIVHVSYNIYAHAFQVDYEAGKKSLYFELDQLMAATKSRAPALGYFRNKQSSAVYPTSFTRSTIPTLISCAQEINRKLPEANARALAAWIDLAVSAHGVATATLRTNQAVAGPTRAPAKGEGQPAAEAKPQVQGKPASRPSVIEDVSGTRVGGVGRTDQPFGLSAAGEGSTPGRAIPGKGAQGGLQEVTPTPRAVPPTEVPPEQAGYPKLPGENTGFGAWLKPQLAYGEVTMAGTKVGVGQLAEVEKGARVVGATSMVAEGAVTVGTKQIAKATVVSGGTVVRNAAPDVGRPLIAAIVLGAVTYLIVSSAEGTEQPAEAPGAPTPEPMKEPTPPGRPGAPVSLPAREVSRGPVSLPGGGVLGPMSLPGQPHSPELRLASGLPKHRRDYTGPDARDRALERARELASREIIRGELEELESARIRGSLEEQGVVTYYRRRGSTAEMRGDMPWGNIVAIVEHTADPSQPPHFHVVRPPITGGKRIEHGGTYSEPFAGTDDQHLTYWPVGAPPARAP